MIENARRGKIVGGQAGPSAACRGRVADPVAPAVVDRNDGAARPSLVQAWNEGNVGV